MKLVLSRKGFDWANGESPSPILPDGWLRSLPIPDKQGNVQYAQIYEGDTYPTGTIIEALTGGKITADSLAHFDPDIDHNALPNRHPNWRGVFGQSEQSQSHLGNQKIGAGDMFLFFGLFQQTEGSANNLKFVKDAPVIHLLWGYLQVGEVVPVTKDTAQQYPQYKDHPHVAYPDRNKGNTIYIAKQNLEVGGITKPLPGYGVFPQYDAGLQLTAEGKNTSTWCLPRWFEKNLTYNLKDVRWSPCETDATKVLLDSARPGQEFVVVNLDDDSAVEWLNRIFTCMK